MNFGIQKDFFDTVFQQIKNKKIPHAYLIETNDFEEIDIFLNLFVKLLLCPKNTLKENCKECEICQLVDCNHYPDLKIIDSQNFQIKKEQLLEVKDSFLSKSIYNNKQIYIIKDASKLNSSSGNTMLKFLEEPEENIIAILLTKNRYNVLDTILSRCQIFSLKGKTNFSFDSKTYDIVKTLFVKNKGFLSYNLLLSLIPDRIEAKHQFSLIEDYLFSIIHNEEQMLSDLKYLNSSQIYKIILILEKYLRNMEYNLNYKLMLDHLLLEIDGVIS